MQGRPHSAPRKPDRLQLRALRFCAVILAMAFCLIQPCHVRAAETAGAPPADSAGLPKGPLDMAAAVNLALRRNPGLAASEAQARASEEARKSVRGAFGPRLGMSYMATRQERSPVTSASRPPRQGTYSWGVEISQVVFQGFRQLASYQRAALQAENDREARRKAELDLTEKVQTVFLGHLRARENVISVGDALNRLRDQLAIARAHYDVGLSPRLDVLQAEVDVSDAERAVIAAENERDTTQAQLNTLLGLPVTARVDYRGDLAPAPFRLTLEQCLERAWRARPDLIMAARSVAIAGRSREEVRSGYYPRVEAYYNITQQGNTPDLRKEGPNGSRQSVWEVGARATWDVFQWGVTHYADQEAGWQVTRMRREEENLRLEVGYDVRRRLLALREAEKLIGVARKGVEQAREAHAVAVARYREHVGTNFDVLDASSRLTAAHAALTGARADYLTALAQLRVAMGELHPDVSGEGAPEEHAPRGRTEGGRP